MALTTHKAYFDRHYDIAFLETFGTINITKLYNILDRLEFLILFFYVFYVQNKEKNGNCVSVGGGTV